MYRKPFFLILFIFLLGIVLSNTARAVDPDLLVLSGTSSMMEAALPLLIPAVKDTMAFL